MSEIDRVVESYSKRKVIDDRYSLLNPAVWKSVQERQRALIKLLINRAQKPLSNLYVLEVGAGSGGNILELLRLGFSPDKMTANELLPDRITILRNNLPVSCRVLAGDATQLDLDGYCFDIVYQSTVFSSLLDDDYQHKFADKMWSWVKPGGGVLWYDFVYDNYKNPDVRGVPLKRIRELFPMGKMSWQRITLAPPISRRVCPIHPFLYDLFNIIPMLRTHVLCWVGK